MTRHVEWIASGALGETAPMPNVDPAIAIQATDAVSRAAIACPQSIVAIQNAATIFGILATASSDLSMLHAELDRICPAWRGNPLATPPPESADVSDLLAQLSNALMSGAFKALPELEQMARDLGLLDLAQAINAYADAGPPPPPPPPTEPPPPIPPPPTTTKKSKSSSGGLIAAGVAALAIVAILFG